MDRTTETTNVEDLARELPEVDWEQPGFPQPRLGFFRRRRTGL